MRREVVSELLDDLPFDDVRAVGSRGDLRRLNVLMGHAGILWRRLARHRVVSTARARPLRLVEIGAGDGTLLLEVARRWAAKGVSARVTLIDRHHLVSAGTLGKFASLGWSVECVATDAVSWLGEASEVVDVMIANLFLHHFSETRLMELLRLAAGRTDLMLACEPRRSLFALTASRWVGLVGCNSVTRHDAVVSVRAGFEGKEISGLWPAEGDWKLTEQPAGLFSHCFVAQRHV